MYSDKAKFSIENSGHFIAQMYMQKNTMQKQIV